MNTNTAESFFALLKRGVHGTFHHISKTHLSRYCDEFSFRWDERKVTDGETDRRSNQGSGRQAAGLSGGGSMMAKHLTDPKETATRKRIDTILDNLKWVTDESVPLCNVFTERCKTVKQQQALKGNEPDYVLYRSGTDTIIAVIEAKRSGQSLQKALDQAIRLYAKPLGVNVIFVADGEIVQSHDCRSGHPYLATLMPNGYWMNAVNGNLGGIGVTPPTTPFVESLATFMTNNSLTSTSNLNAYVGDWGYDPSTDTAWAIVDFQTQAAAVQLTPLPWCLSRARLRCCWRADWR